MENAKWLVSIEGELPQYFKTETEVNKYLEKQAEEMKSREIDGTSIWLMDMKNRHYSQIYNDHPDIIVQLA